MPQKPSLISKHGIFIMHVVFRLNAPSVVLCGETGPGSGALTLAMFTLRIHSHDFQNPPWNVCTFASPSSIYEMGRYIVGGRWPTMLVGDSEIYQHRKFRNDSDGEKMNVQSGNQNDCKVQIPVTALQRNTNVHLWNTIQKEKNKHRETSSLIWTEIIGLEKMNFQSGNWNDCKVHIPVTILHRSTRGYQKYCTKHTRKLVVYLYGL